MQIIEADFNAGGFDTSMVRGGIGIYVWNLAQHFVALGHECSIVTAAHGQLDRLRSRYRIERVGPSFRYTLPLVLDPAKWGALGGLNPISLETEAYRLEIDGIAIYLLSNDMLNRFPDCFYPPYDTNGKDIGFNKHLVFQVDLALFLKAQFGSVPTLVHLHEPFYHFLVPAALRHVAAFRTVSTVQSNMPVDKKVYRPTVEALLEFLHASVDLSDCIDMPRRSDSWEALMRAYLPHTHLHYNYDDSVYVNLYAMVLKWSHGVDFLSEGQRRFYSTFDNTPFRQHFEELGVRRFIQEYASKTFVGGCGVSERWRSEAVVPRSDRGRQKPALASHLDPTRPTFYHSARFAVEHKGQVELVRAIEHHLAARRDANFILRFINGGADARRLVAPLCRGFSENVAFDEQVRPEDEVIDLAKSADFALFPSKFELDTFLIAQGEAMLAGAVPVASAQEGMEHWNHAADDARATGFAVPRVFEEDSALLTDALVSVIGRCVDLYRDRRADYDRMSARARERALTFSWDACARRHLAAFARIMDGCEPDPESVAFTMDVGWYDRLAPSFLKTSLPAVLACARRRGDPHKLLSILSEDACAQLASLCWEAGYVHGAIDLARKGRSTDLEHRIRNRLIRRSVSSDVVEVEYRFPTVCRVHLFARHAKPLDGRTSRTFGEYTCMPMDPGGRLRFVEKTIGEELYFFVTRPDGSSFWDRTASDASAEARQPRCTDRGAGVP